MNRDVLIYLKDILDSIKTIEDYCNNVIKNEFMKDKKLQDAVIRRIEVIGEATKNIPDSFRNKYPTIPWKDIAGMRDVIIHTYFNVNLEMVWKVIEENLPKLKNDIKEIIEKEETKINEVA